MFLIKKIGFDNMENYNPEYEEIIGTEIKARIYNKNGGFQYGI